MYTCCVRTCTYTVHVVHVCVCTLNTQCIKKWIQYKYWNFDNSHTEIPIQKFQACDKVVATLWPGCCTRLLLPVHNLENNFGFETVSTLWQPCNNLAATLLHKSWNSKAWCSVGTLYKWAGIIKYSPLPFRQWMSGYMYCSYVDVMNTWEEIQHASIQWL